MDNWWHCPFYQPIKENNLLTLSASTKKIVSKVTETTVILKFDKKTFARLLIIQKSRNVDLEEVLEHELPPYTTIYCKPRRIIDKNFHVKNIYNNFKGNSAINNNRSICPSYLQWYGFLTKATYRIPDICTDFWSHYWPLLEN